MIRKVNEKIFTLINLANLSITHKSAEQESGSELMSYQPSPYNNNLDLNELLQNVDETDAGELNSISSTSSQ